jgi:magnesium-transporting ATPase (P-type)
MDPLREEAASAVGQLQQIGLRIVLLTGDRFATAQEVSSKLAISDFHTNLNPSPTFTPTSTLLTKQTGSVPIRKPEKKS